MQISRRDEYKLSSQINGQIDSQIDRLIDDQEIDG